MPRETEIKLTFRPRELASIQGWLKGRDARVVGIESLENIYFDTADLALNRNRVALRIRRAGDRFIQTLKTQGSAAGGVHRREEWEWSLTEPSLDLDRLRQTPLSLDESQWRGLTRVFSTNFQRQTFLLEAGDARVECALDHGVVATPGGERPLHEVEFELKAGGEAALLSVALELASRVPVLVNSVSKAEQGYYLAGHYRPEICMPGADDSDPLDGWSLALSRFWLTGDPDQLLAAWGWLNQLGERARGKGCEEDWLRLVETHGTRLLGKAGAAAFSLLEPPAPGRLQLKLAEIGV